jgi:hypothetical protein
MYFRGLKNRVVRGLKGKNEAIDAKIESAAEDIDVHAHYNRADAQTTQDLSEYDPDETCTYSDIQIIPYYQCEEKVTAVELERAMLKLRKRAWQKAWQPNDLDENWELMEKAANCLSAEMRSTAVYYDGRRNAAKQQEEYNAAIRVFYQELDPANTIPDKPLRPLHQVLRFCRSHFPNSDCTPLLPVSAGAGGGHFFRSPLPEDGRSLEGGSVVNFARLDNVDRDSHEIETSRGGAADFKPAHDSDGECHSANLQHGLVCLSEEVLPQAPRSWKQEQGDEPAPLHFEVEMVEQTRETVDPGRSDAAGAAEMSTTGSQSGKGCKRPGYVRPGYVVAKEQNLLPNLTDYAAKIRQYLPEAMQTSPSMHLALENKGLLGFLQPINELCEMGAAAPVRRFVALAGEVAAYNDAFRSRAMNVQEQMQSAHMADSSAITLYDDQAGKARREIQDAMVARGAVVELSSADVKGYFGNEDEIVVEEPAKPRRRDSLKLPHNPMGLSREPSMDEKAGGASGAVVVASEVTPAIAAQMITWRPMHATITKAETHAEQAEEKHFKLLRMWAVQLTAVLALLQSVLSFVLDTSLREHELWPGVQSDTHITSVQKLTSALWYVSGILERVSTIAMLPLEMGASISRDASTTRAGSERSEEVGITDGGKESASPPADGGKESVPRPPPKPAAFFSTSAGDDHGQNSTAVPVAMGMVMDMPGAVVVQGTVVESGAVGIKVDEGPLGIGVRINRLANATSEYPLRFDYYTDTPQGHRTKALSGGKFTQEMVLTHVNGEDIKGE